MELHFARLEAQEEVLEDIKITQKAGLEAALQNEVLEVAASKANNFSVLYFKQVVGGGFFSKKEVDMVAKGTLSKLQRFETYIRRHNCSLNNGKVVTKGNLAFELHFTSGKDNDKKRWETLLKSIKESCPKVKILSEDLLNWGRKSQA